MLIETDEREIAMLLEADTARAMPVAAGGLAPPPVLEMLRDLASEVARQFRPAAWLIVEEGCVVGLLSLKGPPDHERRVEIGYGIAPSFEGRGAATRAIGDFVEWSISHDHVRTILAETAVSNAGSQRVLERNGFERMGSRSDPEDGQLFIWERDVSHRSQLV